MSRELTAGVTVALGLHGVLWTALPPVGWVAPPEPPPVTRTVSVEVKLKAPEPPPKPPEPPP